MKKKTCLKKYLLVPMFILGVIPFLLIPTDVKAEEISIVNDSAIEAKVSGIDEIPLSEQVFVDEEGNTVKIGIKEIPTLERATSKKWEVYYYSGLINANFYMNVSNNKVTSVYDKKVVCYGGTPSEITLTKTSTKGQLDFNFTLLGGIFGGNCWLRGTTTGSNNNIKVTYSM